MTRAAALHEFWDSFGLTAYEENSVPDDAFFPYLTYENVVTPGQETVLTASLWYRSESWVEVNQKAEEIALQIYKMNKPIRYDGGYLWIKGGTMRYTGMGDPSDDLIRRNYITVDAEYLSAY